MDLKNPFYNRKVCDTLAIDTNLFTMEEFQTVKTNLSKAKTSGPDNIPAFLWKHEPFKVNCWSSVMRHTLVICPKHFQGPVSSQYQRQVIYNNLNRITPKLDPIHRRNQNGFRKKRSTLPQIFALRRIIKELKVSITIVSQNRLSMPSPSCTITPPASSRATMDLPTNSSLLLEFFKATCLCLFSLSSWWTRSYDSQWTKSATKALCKEIWSSDSEVFNWPLLNNC